jgi:hypothetical protein
LQAKGDAASQEDDKAIQKDENVAKALQAEDCQGEDVGEKDIISGDGDADADGVMEDGQRQTERKSVDPKSMDLVLESPPTSPNGETTKMKHVLNERGNKGIAPRCDNAGGDASEKQLECPGHWFLNDHDISLFGCNVLRRRDHMLEIVEADQWEHFDKVGVL